MHQIFKSFGVVLQKAVLYLISRKDSRRTKKPRERLSKNQSKSEGVEELKSLGVDYIQDWTGIKMVGRSQKKLNPKRFMIKRLRRKKQNRH